MHIKGLHNPLETVRELGFWVSCSIPLVQDTVPVATYASIILGVSEQVRDNFCTELFSAGPGPGICS